MEKQKGLPRLTQVLLAVFFACLLVAGILIFKMSMKSPAQPANTSNFPVGQTHTTESENQSPLTGVTKIDEHVSIDNTLREVNFCGKTYKSKQVIIDGVDTVHRIAEIITTKTVLPINQKIGNTTVTKEGIEKEVCENLRLNPVDVLSVEVGDKFKAKPNGLTKETDEYHLRIHTNTFSVAIPSGYIYSESAFDGTQRGPIGKLKN